MKIKKAIYILLALLLLFVLWLPVDACAADTTTTQDQQTVQVPVVQWNRLKQITSEQEMTLTSLRVSIKLLKQNSTADKQTLLELQLQLNDCQNRLTSAQQLLSQQSSKLTEASSLLKKNDELLTKLTAQIKALEHHISVVTWQRNLWAGAAIGLAGYTIFNRISD